MKKIILLFVLLAFMQEIMAQTGALSVTNNNTCTYHVIMYAQSVYMGSGGGSCSTIQAIFDVPPGVTYSWTDPYDFETSTSYCTAGTGTCPATPAIGWTALPGGYASVCGTSCFLLRPWSGTYPSDWFWTSGQIDYPGCSCGVTGLLGAASCSGSLTLSGGCSSSASWSYGGSAPLDVTIVVN